MRLARVESGTRVSLRSSGLRTLLLAALAFPLIAFAGPEPYCVDTRLVPFDTFMRHTLVASVPIEVPVPRRYEVAGFGSEALGYAYWMLPKEMRQAEKTQNLPARTGYMYGKLSLEVGYDPATDKFLNVDMESAAPGAFSSVQMYRATARGHAMLFIEVTLAKMDRKIWMLYVALNRETQAAYLTYIPPKNDFRLGDCHWAAFRAAVNAVPVSVSTQEPLAK